MNINSAGLIILALALQLQTNQSSAMEEFAVTEGELAMMPAYCQAKQGRDRNNKAVNDEYRQTYGAQNWRNMHHYCDALKYIIRANRTSGSKADLMFDLDKAKAGIEHLLAVEQTADWVLRPEAHVKLGKVYLRLAKLGRGSAAQAVQNFEKAITIQPDYEPAYSAMSDYYAETGARRKALDVAEEGLKHCPDSKPLLRRFKTLGGKAIPAPLVATPSPAPDKATRPPERQTQPQVGGTTSASPSGTPASSSPQVEQQYPVPEKIGIPSDPWCRFCPDIDKPSPPKSK